MKENVIINNIVHHRQHQYHQIMSSCHHLGVKEGEVIGG